jgi:4-hydroxy-tetrahydrodipicolinate synthase
MTRLAGVFPVIPTPFEAGGAIDRRSFGDLIDFARECDVDGMVFPGMASEVETLTPAERATLVADIGQKIAARMPFIVGASDPDPAQAAARANEGLRAGASAAMVMAPPAPGFDVERQAAYFSAIALATDLPIMLQNAPPPNGAGLLPDSIAAIVAAVPQIRYVKEETMPCGQHVSAILAACGQRLDAVFGGAGARYVLDELARGAAGTMPALELADVHVRMVRAFHEGDIGTARRLYNISLPLLTFQAVFRVRATKAVLHRRRLLVHCEARAAGPHLDAGDKRELLALLTDAQMLFDKHHPDLAHG